MRCRVSENLLIKRDAIQQEDDRADGLHREQNAISPAIIGTLHWRGGGRD